jgi:hypothetical protein
MSRTYKDSPNAKHSRPRTRRPRDISVRAVRRDPPDVRKLSRALISLAMAEAEAAEHEPSAPPTAEPSAPAETEPDE